MKGKKAEQLLSKIENAFGLTKDDFRNGIPIYTKWGTEQKNHNLEDLGDHSLKISKDLGDIYIEKIRTDKWVVVGKGTTLHCDDIEAGEGIEKDFEGFLM